jgi:hypothetical protein
MINIVVASHPARSPSWHKDADLKSRGDRLVGFRKVRKICRWT